MEQDIPLHALIKKYHLWIRRSMEILREGYQVDDVIRARKKGIIPRRGIINEMEFSFHGIGCRTELEGYLVNWDFGPEGRIDGFDAWRLWQFASGHEEEFGELSKLQTLRQIESDLIASNQVYTMHDFGLSGSLLFFKNPLQDTGS